MNKSYYYNMFSPAMNIFSRGELSFKTYCSDFGKVGYLKVQINTTHKRSFRHGITCIYFIALRQ